MFVAELFGATFEVEEGTLLAEIIDILSRAEKYEAWLESHDYNDRSYDFSFSFSELSNLVEKTWETDFHDLVYDVYKQVSTAEHIAYRNYAEADFLEYASHKDEPNFDWDFYSDWHKDIYGFRPRS